METLLDYVKTASMPLNDRPNVSSAPVRSLTLGMVNKRVSGYGISAATTLDKMRLLQLLVGLTRDTTIAGVAPLVYTSICCNVDFACDLHTDSHNSCDYESSIVAIGEFSGGELFLEASEDSDADCEHSGARGVAMDVKRRWCQFDGAKRHGTLPYDGFRVSIVYFSVPIERCDVTDLARLRSLGFRTPAMPLAWPYQIFVCSTRRSATLKKDTLRVLFEDESVPAHSVSICVKDEEDVSQYRTGLRTLVGESGGLPEQRSLCTRYLPHGSWCLFLDDDVCRIHKPDHLSLHQLVMLGFLTAMQRRANLWGLNTSSNEFNLREGVSGAVGLVNGYFFGVVADATISEATRTSDTIGGACEDVERSVRYFSHSGLVRLNFATAVAKTRTNAGGLQSYYADPERRKAAHAYVVQSLATEFPEIILADPLAPNGCRFRRRAMQEEPEPEEGASTNSSEQEEEALVEAYVPPTKAEKPTAGRLVCSECGKSYARSADLKHHVRIAHASEPPPAQHCPVCRRAFRKQKDLLVHQRSGRCWSRRGRPHEDITAPAPSSSAGEQFPALDPASECCGAPHSGLETSG